MHKKLFFFSLILIIFFLIIPASFAFENEKAVIYYNEACSMCAKYIDLELVPILQEAGIQEIEKKDYINNRANRTEFNELNERLGIPIQLQGHFTTFIENEIILEGHIPEHIVRDILKEKNRGKFEKIIIFQDEMDNAVSYKVWAFKGEIKEYAINASITEYLDWFQENKDLLVTPPGLVGKLGIEFWIPLIIVTGLLDGINPCAFGVLLFFIAFLYTVRSTRARLWKVGAVYILMIYLAYLLIGFGILKAIAISGAPHLIGKIGAIAIIILGLINIKDYFWYGKWFSLSIPSPTKKYIVKWTHKATIPSAIILGFLVGLCTFPCSGGIYVAILALLSVQTTYFEGLAYLLLYNLFFVIPLIVILILASSRKVVLKMQRWDITHKKQMKLISGIAMILLAIILWFFSL